MNLDQESLVHGVIRTVTSDDRLESMNFRQINRNAILSLGTMDDFPYLTMEMFHLPGTQELQGTYLTPMIQFAASYRAVEYEWGQWLEKFESLLACMYWRSATVWLETELSGQHVFSWESQGQYHQPGDRILQVRCEWEHELGFV
ncbi:MAG: hypothetical protein LAT62_05555 [Natronospirillum sp.]|uniref:hypothetical protein n=1 Tax=Natronospirillum sp. TaxID=2812955 RepID=UPI0025EB25D6|nr:hypothetical protein [Natronospirillum sp.]MCH8551381.1 hypothetical protein [Natronospirillum sp.]